MSDLKKGDIAILMKYKFSNDSSYKEQLLAFGFIPGIKFEVKRVAPLGDPIELFFNGRTFSFRRFELNLLVIRKI